MATDYYVSLRSQVTGKKIRFQVTPDVMENQSVTYKTVEPIHMPGNFYVYGNSSSRSFNLSNIKLISRTIEEATENLHLINTLRGWTKPYFGRSSTLYTTEEFGSQRENRRSGRTAPQGETAEETARNRSLFYGRELLGAPPDVLLLKAYSSLNRQSPTNIHNVSVVIQNLSLPYPSDVDYIQTTYGTAFPSLMTIDMQLLETHSPREYARFSLQQYRNGSLDGF